MRQLFRYFWGMIVSPGRTLDALATERSVRWGLAAASLGVLQVWGNMALHAVAGLDWLGTRGLLTDPTLVVGFGQVPLRLAGYVPLLAALLPLLTLFAVAATAGLAQLLCKPWRGQGTFEQMVTTLSFASAVPGILIGATTEWIFGVPIDLLTGHDYWWTAAMAGELGPGVGLAWNLYMFGVYLGVQYAWQAALVCLALRRVQKVPVWAAVVLGLGIYLVTMLFWSVFIR
jgi:hypothetical protein